RKPLVIMSPKSLLRHRLAVSPVSAFATEGFHTVIDDPGVADRVGVKTLLLTSGKLYYALAEARQAQAAPPTAILGIEQLYPFPRVELAELFARYPAAKEVRWVQEEPANMGAWRHVRHRLEGVLPLGGALHAVARKAAPAPATGYYALHVEEEVELIERAFVAGPPGAAPGVAATTSRKRVTK